MKKINISRKILLCILGAIWSVAAFNLWFSVDSETMTFIKHPLLFGCLVLFLAWLYTKRQPSTIHTVIGASIFSILYALGVFLDGKTYGCFEGIWRFILLFLPGAFLFFDTVAGWFLSYEMNATQGKGKLVIFEKAPFWTSFIFLLLCWAPYLILYFPGSMSFDSVFQLNMYYGFIPFTVHHPPFSTYFMGWVMNIGKELGNDTIGVFLYTLFQTVLLAGSMAYAIKRMYRYGVNIWFLIGTLLFFGLFPFFPVFAQALIKDTIFTALFLLYTLFMINYFNQKQSVKCCLGCFFVMLFLMLFRNNGMFVVLFTAIGFLFVRSSGKKQWIAISCFALIVNFSMNNFLWPSLSIGEGSKGEMLSIPLQQTARYVKIYGDEVTKEERFEIGKVLEYEGLGERYDPFLADLVKNTYVKDATLKDLADYFKVWFQMYRKHPGVYWESFGESSYHYWYPAVRTESMLTFQLFPYQKGENAVSVTHSLEQFSQIRKQLREKLKIIAQAKGTGLLFRPGLYFWCLLLLIIGFVSSKRKKELIFLLPNFTIWLTNVASPVSGCTRYTLPIMISIPVLIAIYFKRNKVFSK